MRHNLKTATIVGYHGYSNLGDDIFLNVICRWLREHMHVDHCFVTAREGSIEQELSGVRLEPFIKPCRISRLQWISIFLKARRSDFLIFSAGSIFTIQPFLLMYTVLRLLKLLKGKNLQIMAIGVSIGPFFSDHDKYWCARSLELMDYVQVRDSQSSELLKKMNYYGHYLQSYDLALSWKLPAIETSKKIPNLIAIAVTSRGFGFCGDEHSGLCETIFKALDNTLEQNRDVTIKILSVCSDELDGDEPISNHIRDRLAHWGDRIETVVYDGKNIDVMLDTISECSLMISSRMHAGIMAILASVPTYQISYAEKITNFFLHSGVSTDYLYQNDLVTLKSLSEFIDYGLAGDLTEIANCQRLILEEKGRIVSADLSKSAEYPNTN